jgi:3D (Asp-Asp-Asp) domain-containing protein
MREVEFLLLTRTANGVGNPHPGLVDPVPAAKRLAVLTAFSLSACATSASPGSAPRAMDMGEIRPLPQPAPVPAPEPAAPVLSDHDKAMTFVLDAPPEEALGEAKQLWATQYFTPLLDAAPEELSAAFPLLGVSGDALSPRLSQGDWCKAVLQGSVTIREADGTESAYVYVDAKGPEQANCDDHLGKLSDGVKLASRFARFRKLHHPYGCGLRDIPLLPYRTLAVDLDVIPLNTVLYAPALRGQTFELDGKTHVHDGYVFAGDKGGGAIRGAHVDFFTAHTARTPLPGVITSTDDETFAAHVVSPDLPSAKALRDSAKGQCDD